jgi:predicted RND superfamily exporter protein
VYSSLTCRHYFDTGDIFVAVDKWKNARLEHPTATTEYVGAVALPDAASAMFLTTLTTAIAFMATAICPVAPIRMFAIFSGLLIIFDYIMNVLLVFPALCIYDKAFQMAAAEEGTARVNCCISCTCCGMFAPPKAYGDDTSSSSSSSSSSSEGEALDISVENDSLEHEEGRKPSLIRRILLGYYHILHTIRWPLLALCLAALGICIYYSTTLELPTNSDVRMLDEDSQFEQNHLWRDKLLYRGLEKAGGSQGYVIWGVKPADTGDQSKSNGIISILVAFLSDQELVT